MKDLAFAVEGVAKLFNNYRYARVEIS